MDPRGQTRRRRRRSSETVASCRTTLEMIRELATEEPVGRLASRGLGMLDDLAKEEACRRVREAERKRLARAARRGAACAFWTREEGPPVALVLVEAGVELARVALYDSVGPHVERQVLARLAREAWAQQEPGYLRRLAGLLYVHRPVHLVDGGRSSRVRLERCGLHGVLKGGPVKARRRWSTGAPT